MDEKVQLLFFIHVNIQKFYAQSLKEIMYKEVCTEYEAQPLQMLVFHSSKYMVLQNILTA